MFSFCKDSMQRQETGVWAGGVSDLPRVMLTGSGGTRVSSPSSPVGGRVLGAILSASPVLAPGAHPHLGQCHYPILPGGNRPREAECLPQGDTTWMGQCGDSHGPRRPQKTLSCPPLATSASPWAQFPRITREAKALRMRL